MSRLRVGILGCGGIAARHAAAIASLESQMQLVACCARNEDKAREFAARYGTACFIDFTRMLSDAALDLLIVAVPPFAHSGQAERAAAAGIHLLVEKPIALTMERALSMVNAARKSGIIAACGFMYRFGDAVLRWDALAASRQTGRVGMFVGQFHCNALHADWWREQSLSGGQMVEQLIHMVDLARHQLGEPDSVYAKSSNFFHQQVDRYDSDDMSAMLLGYADGRIGVLNACNGAVPGRWDKRWRLVAERMVGDFSNWNIGTFTATDGSAPPTQIDAHTDVFVSQLLNIANAIHGKCQVQVPLEEGARTLAIVLGARNSVIAQREIVL